jgi:hypothetical protein
MNTQRSLASILLILLGLVVIGGGFYFYTQRDVEIVDQTKPSGSFVVEKKVDNSAKGTFNSQEEQNKAREESLKKRYFEQNGLSFSLMSEYADKDLYKPPIKIEGAITDISKWGVNEGEAGNVVLYAFVNGIEKEIAREIISLPGFDYNTNNAKYYFDLQIGDRQWISEIDNLEGYLLFIERNDKDGETTNTIKIPIMFDIPNI